MWHAHKDTDTCCASGPAADACSDCTAEPKTQRRSDQATPSDTPAREDESPAGDAMRAFQDVLGLLAHAYESRKRRSK